MDYRAEIDGLRALAVLPVIFFHAGFKGFSGGFVGVDVFLVISGYLITTIIITEISRDDFSLINFYERRARRILPALFFMLITCLALACLILTPVDLKEFGQSLASVSTFTSNIFFWRETGYFKTDAMLLPLIHTWSLAVEEQYYIFFPVFLLVIWRLGIRYVLVILLIVFIFSLFLAEWGTFNHPTAAFYLLPTRGWEILIGIFIALHLRSNPHPNSGSFNQIASLFGLAMIICSIVLFDESTPFPGVHALIPTSGTALIILSAVPGTLAHKFLSFKPMVAIGLVSYSAYLWHQPVIALTRYRMLGDVTDLMLIGLCILSFVMASISWRFVEQPFRDKNRFCRSVIFRFSLIVTIFFTVFGVSLNFTNGFLGLYQENEKKLYSHFLDPAEYVVERFNDIHLRDFDLKTEKKKIMVIGDSYAQDLTNAVYESGLVDHFELSSYRIPAHCGVLFVEQELLKDNIGRECIALPSFHNNATLLQLIKDADEIWIASIWPKWTVDFIAESVKNIKSLNNNIIVFGSKGIGEVRSSYYKYTSRETWEDPFFYNKKVESFDRLGERNNLIKREVLIADGQFINSQSELCDGLSYCPNFKDYNLISYDGGHLTPFGAKLFGENLRGILLNE